MANFHGALQRWHHWIQCNKNIWQILKNIQVLAWISTRFQSLKVKMKWMGHTRTEENTCTNICLFFAFFMWNTGYLYLFCTLKILHETICGGRIILVELLTIYVCFKGIICDVRGNKQPLVQFKGLQNKEVWNHCYTPFLHLFLHWFVKTSLPPALPLKTAMYVNH